MSHCHSSPSVFWVASLPCAFHWVCFPRLSYVEGQPPNRWGGRAAAWAVRTPALSSAANGSGVFLVSCGCASSHVRPSGPLLPPPPVTAFLLQLGQGCPASVSPDSEGWLHYLLFHKFIKENSPGVLSLGFRGRDDPQMLAVCRVKS